MWRRDKSSQRQKGKERSFNLLQLLCICYTPFGSRLGLYTQWWLGTVFPNSAVESTEAGAGVAVWRFWRRSAGKVGIAGPFFPLVMQ